MSERLILEIEVPKINTEGMADQLAEYELDLWDLLQETLESEVALGVGVRESDNRRTIAAHDGRIIGARLQPEQSSGSGADDER